MKDRAPYSHTCLSCGKRAYVSRSAGKQAAKKNHPDDLLNTYQCPVNPQYWHNGHSQRHCNPPQNFDHLERGA